MSKFNNLIKNEFVKVFAKPTAFIMIALIPLITLGYGLIIKTASDSSTLYSNMEKNDAQRIQSYIEGLNHQMGQDISAEGNLITKNKINIAEDLKSKKIDYPLDSWQVGALMEGATYEAKGDAATAEKFQKAVKNDDSEAYIKLLIAKREENIASGEPMKGQISWQKASLDTLKLRLDEKSPPKFMEMTAQYGMYETDWREDAFVSHTRNKANLYEGSIEGVPLSDAKRTEIEDSIKVLEHRLSKNIPEVKPTTMFGFVLDSSSLISVISIFVIIIAATMMAGEYSSGTIKLLLISPHKRWKLFASKLASVFLISLIFLAVQFISSVLIGGILFGFDFNQAWITVQNGAVSEKSWIIASLIRFLLATPELLVMTSLAIMLAVVMRHSAVAIGVGVAVTFGGQMVAQILAMLNYDFKKFILFMNTNLSVYFPSLNSSMTGSADVTELFNSMYSGMSLTFSLAVLAVYFICFTYIALDSFNRRDIKQS